MSKKLQEHVNDLNEFIGKAKEVLAQYPEARIDTSDLSLKLEGLELAACDHLCASIIRNTPCIQVVKKVREDITLYRDLRADGIPVQQMLDHVQEKHPELYKQLFAVVCEIQREQERRVDEYMQKAPLQKILNKLMGMEEPGEDNSDSCNNPFCPIHGAGTFRDEKPKEPSKNN